MTRLHLPPTDPLEVTRQIYRQAFEITCPDDLTAFVAFAARFRRFSIFNSALIHAQRPGAVLLASASQWARLDREVSENARPVVVLAPFCPVQFLFDEPDTRGRPLTDAERAGLSAAGTAPRATWNRSLEEAKALGVVVESGQPESAAEWRLDQHTDRGRARGDGKYISWELTVDGDLDVDQRFLRLVHELGHIYCGHRGAHPNGAWRSRRDLPGTECEAEAELVCHLVCARAGCAARPLSELQHWMKSNGIATVDMGSVTNAADLVESRNVAGKTRARPPKSGDPLPGQMAMFQ
jgi:hypothetical protein